MIPDTTGRKILLIILAILLPPLAVGLIKGLTAHFWINLLLTIISLGLLGIIHALYIVLTS
jgi:uncharacterized membrane protein YqaE (UPF0057 family)